MIKLAWHAATHPGQVRKLNEDSFLANDRVFVVADGMGGHDAGDVASRIIVAAFERLSENESIEFSDIQWCFTSATVDLRRTLGQVSGGATVVGAALSLREGMPYWVVFNIGDSRIYKFSNNNLELISVDHSVVQEMLDAGLITAEEAVGHPERHVVTRAVETFSDPLADYWLIPALPNQRLLLCSDGLRDELSAERISEVLASSTAASQATERLIAEANQAGGRDNITAVVIDTLNEDQAQLYPEEANTVGFVAQSVSDWDQDALEATIKRPSGGWK